MPPFSSAPAVVLAVERALEALPAAEHGIGQVRDTEHAVQIRRPIEQRRAGQQPHALRVVRDCTQILMARALEILHVVRLVGDHGEALEAEPLPGLFGGERVVTRDEDLAFHRHAESLAASEDFRLETRRPASGLGLPVRQERRLRHHEHGVRVTADGAQDLHGLAEPHVVSQHDLAVRREVAHALDLVGEQPFQALGRNLGGRRRDGSGRALVLQAPLFD